MHVRIDFPSFVSVVIVGRFYIALFSTLVQTRRALIACDSEFSVLLYAHRDRKDC